MRAAQKPFHFTYVTVCMNTGAYYFGVHSTCDLNDGYIGSGQRLWHSIRKHGKEAHQFEVIQMFGTRKEAVEHEKILVTWDLIKSDKACMNLVPGGEGGDLISQHPHREQILASKDYTWMQNTGYRETMRMALKPKTAARLLELQTQQQRMMAAKAANGYKHSMATKEKIRQANLSRDSSVNAQISATLTGRKNPEHSAKMIKKYADIRNHPKTKKYLLCPPNGDNHIFYGLEHVSVFCREQNLSLGALTKNIGHPVPSTPKLQAAGRNTVNWTLKETL